MSKPITHDPDAERRAIHGYLTVPGHTKWHTTCAQRGVSVSAALEALAPSLADLLDDSPILLDRARAIDAARRRRNGR